MKRSKIAAAILGLCMVAGIGLVGAAPAQAAQRELGPATCSPIGQHVRTYGQSSSSTTAHYTHQEIWFGNYLSQWKSSYTKKKTHADHFFWSQQNTITAYARTGDSQYRSNSSSVPIAGFTACYPGGQ